jgi:hypothetical protein
VQYTKSLAISFGIILLSGALAVNAQPLTLTFLSLDPIPSQVVTGDEVVFSGVLTDWNGNGLPGQTVRIEEERATGPNILAAAVTDENGAFETTWLADLDNPAKDRIMSISATFAGDGQYTASKSSRVGMKVAIQTMNVSIKLDKRFYFNGDSAVFTIRFASPRGELFDPETFRAIYDGMTVSLEREDEGIYKFRTPMLVPPKHTLQLIAEKHGYKVFTDAITFDVFTQTALIGVKLDFNWSPQQVLEGMPMAFNLSFTDTNNIVTPFVNYDFIIKKGTDVVLELNGEQTTDGKATHQHTFAEGGKYTVTVKVNGIGQAPDLMAVRLSSDFNIDVIKGTAFAVKIKSLQKGEAMRVEFRNPSLAPSAVYAFSLKFNDPSKVTIRAPTGWNVKTDNDMIKFDTINIPLEPGKILRIRAKVDGSIGSFDWSAMDKDGNILKSGSSKVREIIFR